MKCKKIISLFTSTALIASISSIANSQVSISGYVEASYMAGSDKVPSGTAKVNTTKQLGNETLINIASKGKLSNGMDYSVSQDFESDENGTQVMHGRFIQLSPMAGVNVGYSFDQVKGSEIARTATPYVTNRHTDITGLTGITEPIDVTSGEHSIYLDVVNILGASSQLSFAYAPNLDSASNNGSDRIVTLTNTNSGYAVGYKVTPIDGLTAAVGITKINQNTVGHQNVDMKTYGLTYATAPFAIGVQRYRQEGLKATQAATHKDETTLLSATYSATKQLSIGIGAAEQERTLAGVKGTVDTKSKFVSVGYNLGPVVLSYDMEKNEAIPTAANAAAVSGRDTDMHKV
ncbi:MAG: porin, partial [Candidatus Fonsibacter sp.]|nr:porin [Candidatus Fonsibacter sp.]